MGIQQNPAPLYGLVLSGGKSRRMGQDKAVLLYNGQTSLRRGFDLLSGACAKVFLSCREDQGGENAYAAFPQIHDRADDGTGPMAGILSAMALFPDAAWLVLACDLPLLTPRILETLVARRDMQKSATAYRSSHDGLPEPLCAIYEPAAQEAFVNAAAEGLRCPRKVLMRMDACLLSLDDRQALDNVNAPEDYLRAQSVFGNEVRHEH